MSNKLKSNKSGLKTAYASTIIGIVLVLSVLGISAWILLGVDALKNQKIQELEVDIFFNNSVNELDLKIIESDLLNKSYVENAYYRSSEEAWDKVKSGLGGDSALLVIGGEIPIDHSIIINLNHAYINIDSMHHIENDLMTAYPSQINDISYREEAFKEINSGMEKLVYSILLVGLLLLVVAIALINNTIRLALYSKRFTIKTMQLVGATPRFIRRPFIWQAIWQGLISGILAGALVFGFLLLIEQFLPNIIGLTDIRLFFVVLGGIILFGILITVVSTSLSLRKYLRMKLDSLYG